MISLIKRRRSNGILVGGSEVQYSKGAADAT